MGNPDLCRHGCYWECEHRTPVAAAASVRETFRLPDRDCWPTFRGSISRTGLLARADAGVFTPPI